MVTQFVGISEMSHRRGRKLMTVVVVARVAVSRGAASQARKGDGARGEWRRERETVTRVPSLVDRRVRKKERKRRPVIDAVSLWLINFSFRRCTQVGMNTVNHRLSHSSAIFVDFRGERLTPLHRGQSIFHFRRRTKVDSS